MSERWTVHTVHSKNELLAAIGASAGEGLTPVCIRLGSARYSFPKGINWSRAGQLTRRIRRTPASAFKVAA